MFSPKSFMTVLIVFVRTENGNSICSVLCGVVLNVIFFEQDDTKPSSINRVSL